MNWRYLLGWPLVFLCASPDTWALMGGACCLVDGSCKEGVAQEACYGQGGDWRGLGTHCPEACNDHKATCEAMLLKDFTPGYQYTHLRPIAYLNGRLYYEVYERWDALWVSEDAPDSAEKVGEFVHLEDEYAAIDGSLFLNTHNDHEGPFLTRIDGSSGQVQELEPYVSDLSSVTMAGEKVFFQGNFWSTYGDELGMLLDGGQSSALVKDIYPGRSDSFPEQLCAVGSTLFFTATDGVHGRELWKSDGTEAGTVLVKDIHDGASSSTPKNVTAVGEWVFFSAHDGIHGRKLWRSDGTEEGTVLVKNIREGFNADLAAFTAVDGMLFFTVDDGIHGRELWKSDGTESGTQLVRDIRSDAGSNPLELMELAGALLFTADDGIHGRELWISDGTEAGTQLLKDINDGGASSSPANLIKVNGKLFFGAQSQDDGGIELWFSDGTPEGTLPVEDGQETWAGYDFHLEYMIAGDEAVYFRARAANGALELWRTDGTASGAYLLHSIERKPNDSNPNGLIEMNGAVYFGVPYPQRCWYCAEREFWKTDGTVNGTVHLDLQPDGFYNPIRELSRVHETLYFVGSVGEYHDEYDEIAKLWRSDGTESGSYVVESAMPGFSYIEPRNLKQHGNSLYFSASSAAYQNRELWRTEANGDGVVLVKDIRPGNAGAEPQHLTSLSHGLYFSADDGVHGRELWKSGGNSALTVMVKDIQQGGSSTPRQLTNVNNTLFFTADDGIHGRELWKSDGTRSGTVLVKDINPSSASSTPEDLVNVHGLLYFFADDGIQGKGLWKSDGATEGTVMVAGPWIASTAPSLLTHVNGRLFFRADDGVHGLELWTSDGTAAGTTLVKNIYEGGSASPADFAVIRGLLYFSADDGIHGAEMWRSDGTSHGTVRLTNINPDGSSSPSQFTLLGEQIVFAAYTPVTGRELWTLDMGCAGGSPIEGEGTPYPEGEGHPHDEESFLHHAGQFLLNQFRDLDADGNGMLSLDETRALLIGLLGLNKELDGYAADLFEWLDANGDGFLSVGELRDFAGDASPVHIADQNGNQVIELRELLRVIQFFNVGAYACALNPGATEDGYLPGDGPGQCLPHDSDYNPLDWQISLSELLRLIQLYNSGGYHACVGEEDRFCAQTAQ